uniref:Uncharacterized protein n=1 Tax=Arundo donax TaxID=35708 RepID=A0A0A8XZ13_ARUDO
MLVQEGSTNSYCMAGWYRWWKLLTGWIAGERDSVVKHQEPPASITGERMPLAGRIKVRGWPRSRGHLNAECSMEEEGVHGGGLGRGTGRVTALGGGGTLSGLKLDLRINLTD